MKIDEMYPARTDSNGNTWYRPVQEPGLMWGWTSDPKQAHPDYRVNRGYTDPQVYLESESKYGPYGVEGPIIREDYE